jgi:hypothetical protein
MADHEEERPNGELAREIAEFAIYELKNQVEGISEMSVKDQEKVKEAVHYAARTILDQKLRDGVFDGR